MGQIGCVFGYHRCLLINKKEEKGINLFFMPTYGVFPYF